MTRPIPDKGLAQHIAVQVLLLLSGCATSARVEVEHVSHPLAGWPLEPQAGAETGLTQAVAMARWQEGPWYAEAGLGVNLRGADGGGFTGGALTGIGRAGYEWRFK